MAQAQKKFKQPPKRFQPRGLSVVYEDRDILVVDKMSSLLTVSNDKVRDHTAYYLLNDYVRKGNPKSKNKALIVHRLDRDTSGVLVFAKSEEAQSFLQDEWLKFDKKYYAVVLGKLEEKEGVVTSYLAESSALKMYSVNDPKKGKLAKTRYKVLRESTRYSLLEVNLLTGRKNQIRVHMADKGCPVVGDKKYGKKDKAIKRLALHAASLSLIHPFSKKEMTFTTEMPIYFESLMNRP
jgi:RluA family pseudouridine synthase